MYKWEHHRFVDHNCHGAGSVPAGACCAVGSKSVLACQKEHSISRSPSQNRESAAAGGFQHTAAPQTSASDPVGRAESALAARTPAACFCRRLCSVVGLLSSILPCSLPPKSLSIPDHFPGLLVITQPAYASWSSFQPTSMKSFWIIPAPMGFSLTLNWWLFTGN